MDGVTLYLTEGAIRQRVRLEIEALGSMTAFARFHGLDLANLSKMLLRQRPLEPALLAVYGGQRVVFVSIAPDDDLTLEEFRDWLKRQAGKHPKQWCHLHGCNVNDYSHFIHSQATPNPRLLKALGFHQFNLVRMEK